MHDIECPTPAYNRLRDAGLIERIFAKQKSLHEMFLYDKYLEEGGGKRWLNWAEKIVGKSGRKISEKSETARDILELDFELDEYFNLLGNVRLHNTEGLFIDHPSFLAMFVLGKDVLRFREYGFPTRRSLEKSINSFCIGEYTSIMGWNHSYIWRNGDVKNTISQNMHGDFYASQVDVSGKDIREETLFGTEEIFDSVKNDCYSGGIGAYQDWSVFLVANLKYAQDIGRAKILEIVNWRNVLEETGFVGTNTCEAECGIGGMSPVPFLMESEILKFGFVCSTFPLRIVNRDSAYLPCVRGENLLFLDEERAGDIEISYGRFGIKRFGKRIEYSPEDLPHVLRATYKYFARDRRLLPQIMDTFLKETR